MKLDALVMLSLVAFGVQDRWWTDAKGVRRKMVCVFGGGKVLFFPDTQESYDDNESMGIPNHDVVYETEHFAAEVKREVDEKFAKEFPKCR